MARFSVGGGNRDGDRAVEDPARAGLDGGSGARRFAANDRSPSSASPSSAWSCGSPELPRDPPSARPRRDRDPRARRPLRGGLAPLADRRPAPVDARPRRHAGHRHPPDHAVGAGDRWSAERVLDPVSDRGRLGRPAVPADRDARRRPRRHDPPPVAYSSGRRARARSTDLPAGADADRDGLRVGVLAHQRAVHRRERSALEALVEPRARSSARSAPRWSAFVGWTSSAPSSSRSPRTSSAPPSPR